MTALTLLVFTTLSSPPAMSANVFSIQIPQPLCQARALRAFAALQLTNIRTEGATVFASSEQQSAAIACIATLDETTVSVTTAGPSASTLSARIEKQLRYGELKGDGPFTGVWESAQWGLIILEQRGDDVRGTYTCCGSGTLEGKAKNNTVKLTWTAKAASDSMGETAMRLMKNGDLDGSWCSGKGCAPKEEHPFVGTRQTP